MDKQMPPESWVIRERATGRVMFETFNARTAAAINTAKYEAVPILEYLQSINGKAKEQA